jgi:DNA-binding CsgD family transcriptional regulator
MLLWTTSVELAACYNHELKLSRSWRRIGKFLAMVRRWVTIGAYSDNLMVTPVPTTDVQRNGSEDQSDNTLLAEVGLIGAVAQWCECLHGRDPLLRSLEVLGTGLNAEIVAVARYPHDGRSAVRSVIWDRKGDDHTGAGTRTFARALIGAYLEAARPGSLWFRSTVETSGANDVAEFHAARQLRELAVIPLQASNRFIDTFEIHFSDRLRSQQQVVLTSLAPVLARTWRNRAEGLFTEALLRVSPASERSDVGRILSVENPARLSRAEYRVSLLLSRGLSIQEVKAELCIRESTMRSHLSSLYAKTNCTSLSELVFRLTSPDSPRAAFEKRVRSAS